MRKHLAIASVLASTILMTSTAFAQSSPPASPAPAPAASSTPAEQKATTGQWRASKLIGLDVYNDQNEKLGDISELLLDPSGKVAGVLIGVGGFLGVGQRDIMVGMDKLKFVNEPVRMSSTAPAPSGTTRPAGTTGAATTPPATRASTEKWYPDHAVLAGVTKDQINTMKEFKYD